MATTLQIPSFAQSNIKERTALTADYVSGTTLVVESTQGFLDGDILYVGQLSREGCEKASLAAVATAITLTLDLALSTPHSRLDDVTSVLGDTIKIYRAPDVDGTVPLDDSFIFLAFRTIDPDQQSTYYTDSSGSSAFWYRYTYYNPTTGAETSLLSSEPVRGDDFGHYASVGEIRSEAGFDNAFNLSDVSIDQQRRAAEAEINSTLRSAYTVPFVKPIPQRIRFLTIKLAAGFLLQKAYGSQSNRGDDLVKDVRAQLAALQDGSDVLDDDTVTAYDGSGISSWPNDSTASTDVDLAGGGRAFQTGDIY